jgi:hypothetical protein
MRYFLIALLFSLSFAFGERCGTMRFIENLKNPQKKTFAKKYSAESVAGIQERRTAHFIIFYVTEGIDAAKPAYIDSLAMYLEQAYDLHKNTLGMKSIRGVARTGFYDKAVPSGLYPIEIIDTGDSGYCGTYGLTFPLYERKPGETQIALENDFIYGVDCPEVRRRKGDPFISSINGDYSKNWHLALKVTVFHELYHSFQMSQFNFLTNNTFWLEASATGVEEIGAPEVNDYIEYLSGVFNNPGKSMEDIDRTDQEAYGYATLYLFLSSELGLNFDSYIWDYFSAYPKETFAVQLARYVYLHGKEGDDVEDLFHKYATHIFFSGTRAESSPYSFFWEDMPKWPDWKIGASIPRNLPAGTFNFIRTPIDEVPSTDSVARITPLFKDNSYFQIHAISRLLQKTYVPPVRIKEFAAYPNPWRAKHFEKVKFGPLPKESKGVEIRSANGALLKRIEGQTGDTLTWQPEKLPAPGILYYRTLPYGKNKMLILEH